MLSENEETERGRRLCDGLSLSFFFLTLSLSRPALSLKSFERRCSLRPHSLPMAEISKDEHGLERVVLRGPEVRRRQRRRKGHRLDHRKRQAIEHTLTKTTQNKKKNSFETEILRHRLPPRRARHLLDLPQRQGAPLRLEERDLQTSQGHPRRYSCLLPAVWGPGPAQAAARLCPQRGL